MIFNVMEYCSCGMIEFGRSGSFWSRFKKIKILRVSLVSQKNSLEGFLNIKNQKINNCFLRHCNLEIFYNLMQTSKKCGKKKSSFHCRKYKRFKKVNNEC